MKAHTKENELTNEAVKLHRCPFTWPNGGRCHCTPVQRALEDAGVPFEIIKQPSLPRSRRKRLEVLSGQRYLPVVEFGDGSTYREESEDMAVRIRAGKLFEASSGTTV